MGGMEIGDDVFVGAAVLNLYAKCGKMDEAMRCLIRIRWEEGILFAGRQ